ncbi:protein phosphatase 1 regulatory subunit 3C-B-like isoform X2 [Scyliorhinus canicula]|uniref:protein phosphatase 1 regulatory subunit 3C-B-like isoform X2 n=1 Tax=Scyliorhinus canicula TaxID=7830 RepID=UPI0018F6B469|nr:protein phosphatase 1 regulatory subunit 3C-B-like isoform X2 [Scyliorhinus canicula]
MRILRLTQLSPAPAMPVDIAMRLCLSHSPPIHSFLSYPEFRAVSVSRLQPLRPCLNPKSGEVCLAGRQRPGFGSGGVKKKKVVFADAKGLSLTAVHLFSDPEDDLSDLQFELSELAGCVPLVAADEKFALDFPPPSADYLDFRSRLLKNSVCLESCLVQGTSISGTVKVKNLGYEKKVAVRITFDSWKSFRDVECSYLNNTYGCADTDTFSFELDVPADLRPLEQIEFCVSFQCGQHTFWDNNSEQNYRIKCIGGKSGGGADHSSLFNMGEKSQEGDVEQFGSPRSINVIFSQWQSWGRFDNDGYW